MASTLLRVGGMSGNPSLQPLRTNSACISSKASIRSPPSNTSSGADVERPCDRTGPGRLAAVRSTVRHSMTDGHGVVDHLADLGGGLVGEALGHDHRAGLGDAEGLGAEVGVLVEDRGRVADRRHAAAFELAQVAHQPRAATAAVGRGADRGVAPRRRAWSS